MNDYLSYRIKYSNELYHYGVKGQKWGIRRYQNEDGTLTDEGRIKLKELATKQGYITKLEYENRESAAKGKKVLYPKGELKKYYEYKKDVDKLLDEFGKQDVYIVSGTKEYEDGKKYVGYAFDYGNEVHDMNDMKPSSVYNYRIK